MSDRSRTLPGTKSAQVNICHSLRGNVIPWRRSGAGGAQCLALRGDGERKDERPDSAQRTSTCLLGGWWSDELGFWSRFGACSWEGLGCAGGLTVPRMGPRIPQTRDQDSEDTERLAAEGPEVRSEGAAS